MRGAFGVVVVPEPTMFGVGGSSDPVSPTLAMPSPLLLEGIVVWEATAVSEVQQLHNKWTAPSGWSMAPDPRYLSSSGGLAISNSKVVGTTCELRLVALRCGCMVDEG